MMNLKTWGRPYRTSTIPSSRGSKPLDNTRRLPPANSSFSVNKDHQRKRLNDHLLQQRKESHLNSQFNRRRNTLKQITRENHKIYQRINSQKSLYNQSQMNKSTDSLRSLSRCSSRSKNTKGKNVDSKKSTINQVSIKSQNIKNVKQENLQQFRQIFSRQGRNQENSKLLANEPNRSLSVREPKREPRPLEMGCMLHRIAEELMNQKPKTKQGGRRKLLY